MTISGIHRGGLTPHPAASSALSKVIVIIAWWMAVLTIPAHSQIQQARITRIDNTVTLHRSAGSNPGSVMLKVGDLLQLGDIIVTGNGTVVIGMGDGSQVTIYPNSRVKLKDFSSAGSWRDLLEVVVGRIRAKINHGKRPNPYRVYSPIASIAVRGTEFLVIVESNGETRVFVFEGLVEVSSLINPQQSVLVKPGRNIVVRPDGDISMVMSVPRGELNEIRGLQEGWSGPGSSLRSAYYSHQGNFPELRSSRFTAFRDSHFDSLLNPAYATEFRETAGRFYLIPSFNPRIENSFFGSGGNNRIDRSSVISSNFTLSPQGTFFTPIGSRMVVGGGAAVTRTSLGGTESEIISDITNGANQATHNDGSLGFTTANLSLMAARRFGKAERTSFGIKFDYLEDRSSYSFNTNTNEPMNRVPAHQEGNTRDHRSSLTIGITQNFGDDEKLGVYYRYTSGSIGLHARESGSWGFISINGNESPHFFPGSEYFRTRPGHSSEAGILLRGSVTRRLFYGVESSILYERDQLEVQAPSPITVGDITYNVTQFFFDRRRARRGIAGAGVGYALRPRTVLSVDVSAGLSRQNSLGQTIYSPLPEGIFIGAADSFTRERSSFRGLHIGGQTDVWRNLFAGGSLFFINERRHSIDGLDSPEETRTPNTIDSQELSFHEKYKLTNIRLGWRLKPSWIVQYVYSTNYGRSTPTHSLMFRWEFGGKQGSNE